MQTFVPILAQGLPSPPFSVVGMPPLAVPLVSQQTALAKRWQDQHPGADPVRLQVGERRANAFARAAFWLATRDLSGEQGAPAAGICDSCGRSTYSWCEGCYLRTAGFPVAKFAALCSPCDRERFVCHNCQVTRNRVASRPHEVLGADRPAPWGNTTGDRDHPD